MKNDTPTKIQMIWNMANAKTKKNWITFDYFQINIERDQSAVKKVNDSQFYKKICIVGLEQHDKKPNVSVVIYASLKMHLNGMCCLSLLSPSLHL